MDRLGLNKYHLESIEKCAKLYDTLKKLNIEYPINFIEIIENVDFNTKISELPERLDIHIRNLISIKECAMKYNKYKKYGGGVLINFKGIVEEANLNAKVADLSKIFNRQAYNIRRSTLVYEYPHTTKLFMVFVVLCCISCIIPFRWTKTKLVSVVLTITMGFITLAYAVARFDIES